MIDGMAKLTAEQLRDAVTCLRRTAHWTRADMRDVGTAMELERLADQRQTELDALSH